MASDPKEAALALHRFGFAPRAGSIAAIASDPRGAIIADLDRPGAGQIAARDLLTSGGANRAVFEYNAERTAAARLERNRQEAAQRSMENSASENPAGKPQSPTPQSEDEAVALPRQIFLNEAQLRFDAAVDAEIGFVERLVWFWSNHFCINTQATVMAGAYEREVIRTHVLDRFADMLLAAEGHPAMLLYLDNALSMGPNSVAGINRDKGLNENLARETLELHTLGVRTVYTQDDVINFAKVITGWTILPTASNPEHGGEFVFNPRMHEPGSQVVVGRAYADTGVEQGRTVLLDLARHPATARHVATKLVHHFIADEAPPELIDRLTRCFVETDGDLKELAKCLVRAPESWAPERAKVKRPGEWIVAALRATGLRGSILRITAGLALLGEPLWQPPAPKGFADENAVWLGGLGQRLSIANTFAARVGQRIDPQAAADAVLGPLLSSPTREAIAAAESKPQALTLLLMAPEFQRR